MEKFEKAIDAVAEALYNTHWGPNRSTGNSPPRWTDISYETREFVRKQAFTAAKRALSIDWSGTEFEEIARERSTQ